MGMIGYYATLRRYSTTGARTAWLAGPFRDHDDAKSIARMAHDAAVRHDPRCSWDMIGTSSITRDAGQSLPTGVLNEHLGLTLDTSGFVAIAKAKGEAA